MDVKEYKSSGQKHKYLVVVDEATRYARALHLFSCPENQSRNVKPEEVVNTFAAGWIEIWLPQISAA